MLKIIKQPSHCKMLYPTIEKFFLAHLNFENLYVIDRMIAIITTLQHYVSILQIMGGNYRTSLSCWWRIVFGYKISKPSWKNFTFTRDLNLITEIPSEGIQSDLRERDFLELNWKHSNHPTRRWLTFNARKSKLYTIITLFISRDPHFQVWAETWFVLFL